MSLRPSPLKTRKTQWNGFELKESATLRIAAPVFVYNTPHMARPDKNTVLTPGLYKGTVDFISVGDTVSGKTPIHFLHYKKVKGDKVLGAEIVGELILSNEALKSLHEQFTAKLKSLDHETLS